MALPGRPDQDVNGGSINVAEGFVPVQRSIEALTQAVQQQTAALRAVSHMQTMLGTSGSSPYSEMVDGGSALAGGTNIASLNAGRYMAQRPSGIYAPFGEYAPTSYGAPLTNPAPPAPAAAAPAAPSPNTFTGQARKYQAQAGGYLRQAGQATFNPMGIGGGAQQPPGGPGGPGGPAGPPMLSGGSHGGSGSGSGLYGGIMGGLQKVPYVGSALAITDEIQSQRQKNAYYQNIEGTNNAHGFGERWNEALGSFTTMGMFAPGEYAEAYKGATALGYTDRSDKAFQSRQGILNFAYTNKREMGMDASESLQYASMASKSASTSFTALTKVLQQVSEDANKAGVNANLARQQTMAYYSTMLQSGMTGPAATQTAGAMGMFQTSMGRTYSDVDMKGAYSTGMNYMVASTNGMTYNQFMATQNKDPMRAEQMRSKTMGQGLDAVITAEMKAWIKQQVQAAGGVAAIEADAQISGQGASILDSMFSDFLAAFPSPDWNSVRSILQTFSGQKFTTDTQAFQFLVNWVVGIDMHSTATAAAKASQIQSGGLTNNISGGKGSIADFEEKAGKAGPMGWGGASGATKSYENWSTSAGKRDPVIESILTGMNEGGYSQTDQKVEVITSGGPRVVSLQEAIEKFQNQLASGKAKFVGGSLSGQNASAFGAIDTTRKSAADAEAANTSNASVGQSLTDYLKANPVNGASGQGGSNVGVTISLSQQAAQFLSAVVTPNDQLTDPNASGGQTDAGRAASGGWGQQGFNGSQGSTQGYGGG